MSKYMLILSCTDEQKKYIEPQKSILVFNDSIYKYLREELKKEDIKNKLDVLIISTKFNIIPSTVKIKPYDRIIDEELFEKNIDINTYLIKKYIITYKPEKIVALLEEPYEKAVRWEEINKDIEFLNNNDRLSELKKWLQSI